MRCSSVNGAFAEFLENLHGVVLSSAHGQFTVFSLFLLRLLLLFFPPFVLARTRTPVQPRERFVAAAVYISQPCKNKMVPIPTFRPTRLVVLVYYALRAQSPAISRSVCHTLKRSSVPETAHFRNKRRHPDVTSLARKFQAARGMQGRALRGLEGGRDRVVRHNCIHYLITTFLAALMLLPVCYVTQAYRRYEACINHKHITKKKI